MSSSAQKLSFTIRRPTPTSRASSTGADSDSSNFKLPALPKHLSSAASMNGHNERQNRSGTSSPLGRASPAPKPNSRTYNERDSSEDEDEGEDELVTGFDQFGVQRLHEKKKGPEGPLVIPALKNRDWRELAKKRKMLYVPPNATPATGADGSVGGLGTRDTINSGPQLSGLQFSSTKNSEEGNPGEEETKDGNEEKMDLEGEVNSSLIPKEEETEDQKALRAILSSANGTSSSDGPSISIIGPISEEDAYAQDITTLPESSTLEDYERIPVEQFGAALLRGMGWKEGTAATKRTDSKGKPKGIVEPWLPQARPALLGIGAKEKEALDDGSTMGKGGKKGGKRPDKKYVPVVKVERQREGEPNDGEREREREEGSRSGTSSRRRTPEREPSSRRRSPEPSDRRRKDKRDSDYNYERDRKRDSHREKDRERRKEREYDSGSSSRRDREREKSPERHATESSGSGTRRRDRDRRDY